MRPTVRGLPSVLAALVVLTSLTAARATAPTSQYGFFAADSPTVEDLQTKLVWQRGSAPGTRSFAAANAYCDSLTFPDSSARFRLPSYRELSSLIDETPRIYADQGVVRRSYIYFNPFPDTLVDAPYWTSTPSPLDPGNHLAVEFSSSNSGAFAPGVGLAVRCVQR